ncbi:hypothetical protein DRQ53_02810 [bacterium]|nr:MAG: hypothetical protein DRQ53_02810 [bacterium]
MMRQKSYNAIGRANAVMASAMILALVCTSVVAVAGQVRVVTINGNEGVPSVVEGRGESDSAQSSTGYVHLRGYAEHSRSRGLIVAGQRVELTRSTSVYPSLNGLSSGLRDRQISGREVTIFGKTVGGVVQAVLVIMKPTAADLDNSWSASNRTGTTGQSTASDGNARVEIVPSNSPE